MRVLARCSSCDGTGLYCGFAEPPGEAVVCLTCSGSGCEVIQYVPYKGRTRKRGVTKIRQSAGRFIATGVGGQGAAMTYAEFERKVRPARLK